MGGFRDLLWDRGGLVGTEHLYYSKSIFYKCLFHNYEKKNPVQIFSFWKEKTGRGKNQGLIRFKCWGVGGTHAGGRLPGWAEGKGEIVGSEVRRREFLFLPCSFLSGSSCLLASVFPSAKWGS